MFEALLYGVGRVLVRWCLLCVLLPLCPAARPSLAGFAAGQPSADDGASSAGWSRIGLVPRVLNFGRLDETAASSAGAATSAEMAEPWEEGATRDSEERGFGGSIYLRHFQRALRTVRAIPCKTFHTSAIRARWRSRAPARALAGPKHARDRTCRSARDDTQWGY